MKPSISFILCCNFYCVYFFENASILYFITEDNYFVIENLISNH